MRYIFFGTPEFAAIIIEKLIKAGFAPEAVICNPDRPVGRKKIITPPPIKLLIQKLQNCKIEILQPEDLKAMSYELKAFSPDLFIVTAYAKIIPEEILDIPRLGAIGVHPSLLPKYRGAAPIQSAILNGENKTGVTLYLLDEKVDHGPILAKRELEILNSPDPKIEDPRLLRNRDNFEILNKKLAELAADLLIETLPDFLAGKITPLPQNEAEATYTKKFKTEDAYIDLTKDNPIIIERKVRALNPEPGVWTIWQGGKPFDTACGELGRTAQGKRMKILEVELIEGKLKLKKIQFEGKKPTLLNN